MGKLTPISIKRPSNGKVIRIYSPNPIFEAVCLGQSEIVAYLLTIAPSEGNSTCIVEDYTSLPHNYEGVSSLYIACIRGDRPCVKVLLKAGVDISAQTSLGDSCLMEACFEGDYTRVMYFF